MPRLTRRRAHWALALTTSMWLAGGCTTFTDNDAVARVGDAELSQTALDGIVAQSAKAPPASSPPDGTATTPSTEALTPTTSLRNGDDVRTAISTWIINAVIRDDLAARDASITDAQREQARTAVEGQNPEQFAAESDGWQSLVIDQVANVQAWVELGAVPGEMESFRAVYDEGIEVSGAACTAHILVETGEQADEILDELDGDPARFAEVARASSTDTGSAPNGGVIPCSGVQEFTANIAPEYVEAALAADVGEILGPVQTDFGYHVILVRTFDGVAEELASVDVIRFANLARRADISVDPRYGSFDPARISVAPLGPEPAATTLPLPGA